jgi:hypothetical protein
MDQGLEIDQSEVSHAFLPRGFADSVCRVDSIESMKAQLPALRKKLVQDPEYFKKVYTHTFTLSLAPGARSLELEPGKSAIA